MNKEKFWMSSFIGVNLVDSYITYLALLYNENIAERGYVPQWFLENTGNMENLIITKMVITSAIIGAYVLTHNSDNERAKYIAEKTIQMSSIIIWSAQAWNVYFILNSLQT